MLSLSLLGPFRATLETEPLADFRTRKVQALLIYLAAERGIHSRDRLLDLLWPGLPQKSARSNLRQVLYYLRRALPDAANSDAPYVIASRKDIRLNPEADVSVDTWRLESALRSVRAHEHLDANLCVPCCQQLEASVALYRGPFLADFYLDDSSEFEQWVSQRRAAFERMALEALEALASHHLQHGDSRSGERYARRQVALDNLRERGQRQLIQALAEQGKRNEALTHYQSYCELLEEELSVAPSAEMVVLHTMVRAGRVETATKPAPSGQPAVRPAPSEEAATTPAVAGETGSMRQRRSHPHPMMPFVGRKKALAEVGGWLEDGRRLITLFGPGGSGKTRLALEIARRQAALFRNGTAFVELAPLSDADAIPTAIATALDFRLATAESPKAQVIAYLANKELLLVLDNFEHLPDGAGLVNDLLECAPDLRIITTSRALLGLGSEYLFDVGGLDVPETDPAKGRKGFEAVEAVALFMGHARRVRPGLVLEETDKRAVARICRVVEGIPLAIEMAASWVRYVPPTEIAENLADDLAFVEGARADLPARQRSMEASFTHSWKQMGRAQQAVLVKLSVFRGGASRRAARAVTGASLSELVELADHALLSLDPTSGRLAIHEVIRQSALKRLKEGGKVGEVRDRHSAYFLRRLADLLPDLKGRDQIGALDAIEGDFDNVRAAWNWAVRLGRWRHFKEASQSLYLFTFLRTRYWEGIELFETARSALSSPVTAEERLVRAYVAANRQALLAWTGDFDRAFDAVPAMQEMVEGLTDPAAVAYCRMLLGRTLGFRVQSVADAIGLLEAALGHYQQTPELFYRAMAYWWLGYPAYSKAGRFREAHQAYASGLPLARKAGDLPIYGALLHNLGASTDMKEGPSAEVERYYQKAANVAREYGSLPGYAFSLALVAHCRMWREGDLAGCRPIVEEAVAIADELNVAFARNVTLPTVATFWLLEGRYERVATLVEEVMALKGAIVADWCFERAILFLANGDVDDAIPLMKCWFSDLRDQGRTGDMTQFLAYGAVVLALQGSYAWAAELLAPGLTDSPYRGGLGIDPLITRTRAELEEILGAESFAAAWERGKEIDPVAAAQEVMEALSESG